MTELTLGRVVWLQECRVNSQWCISSNEWSIYSCWAPVPFLQSKFRSQLQCRTPRNKISAVATGSWPSGRSSIQWVGSLRAEKSFEHVCSPPGTIIAPQTLGANSLI